MNITVEFTKSVFAIVLSILSIITSSVEKKYKGEQESVSDFFDCVYDAIILLSGGLLTLGTFGIIWQLIESKVKMMLTFYEIAKIADGKARAYKRPLITLFIIAIIAEMALFILGLVSLNS